jgi:lipoprotein signal peptidase
MSQKLRHSLILFLGGVLFLVDRLLKWQTLHDWNHSVLLNRWFGWYPFLNTGIAFSIPVPVWLTVTISLPLVVVLGIVIGRLFLDKHPLPFLQKQIPFPAPTTSLFVVVPVGFGALSNILDRILYRSTIDYLLILTGVINLADVMIALGFVIYLWSLKRAT